ncbi:MAG: NAD(P)H-dependent oxidoreductase subunit E [Chitinophagales bacterium]|nr:NAD(P)H-dependent oxidoreductase subunit E [Chitinophagales bacterium]MCO5281445.1 NAD(P)H-dependent oxidoreductase subunit E [Chitinophagales bacterium]OJV27786.1 MAG: NAD(P)H-dependent oxidoreductase subunit E [Bacteroidetes bacterium 37-13]HRN94813.1 NAD(P)H-dependent oxidoreductase subunit E [Chitinophagales bacterium]HRP38445.1 NAD(P)H-dependent oxidoreductase subunit E [Chitinophagales bacterium]
MSLNIKSNKEVKTSERFLKRVEELKSWFPEGKHKSALLTVLHEMQDENDNWLSVEAMDKVAELLNIKPIEVYEVVSFYSMYNQKPVGKYSFEFCQTSCCGLRGADDMIEYTCKKLGVKEGEVTPDGMFSVKGVECLGACGYAPMMQVGDFYHEFLTPKKIDQLIEDCRAGKVKTLSEV